MKETRVRSARDEAAAWPTSGMRVQLWASAEQDLAYFGGVQQISVIRGPISSMHLTLLISLMCCNQKDLAQNSQNTEGPGDT